MSKRGKVLHRYKTPVVQKPNKIVDFLSTGPEDRVVVYLSKFMYFNVLVYSLENKKLLAKTETMIELIPERREINHTLACCPKFSFIAVHTVIYNSSQKEEKGSRILLFKREKGFCFRICQILDLYSNLPSYRIMKFFGYERKNNTSKNLRLLLGVLNYSTNSCFFMYELDLETMALVENERFQKRVDISGLSQMAVSKPGVIIATGIDGYYLKVKYSSHGFKKAMKEV